MLIPITELIASTDIYHEVKDELGHVLQGIKLTFDQDLTQNNATCIIGWNVEKDKILEIQKQLNFLQQQGLITFRLQATSDNTFHIFIDQVNPDNFLKEIEQANNNFKQLNITDPIKNTLFSQPTPATGLEFNKQSHQNKTTLTKEDLTNIENVKLILQRAQNINALRVEKISFITKILQNFSKYNAIVEYLMYEYILRGCSRELENLLKITSKTTVERTSFKFKFNSSSDPNLSEKIKTVSETNSYELTLNFNRSAFLDYVREKKKNCGNEFELGLRDEIEASLKCIYPADPKTMMSMMDQFDCYEAYQKMNFLQLS